MGRRKELEEEETLTERQRKIRQRQKYTGSDKKTWLRTAEQNEMPRWKSERKVQAEYEAEQAIEKASERAGRVAR